MVLGKNYDQLLLNYRSKTLVKYRFCDFEQMVVSTNNVYTTVPYATGRLIIILYFY